MKQLFYYLNYIWRVLATGLCFACFGIGGLCLGYIIIPLAKLTTTNPKLKKFRAQHAISLSFKFFVFALHRLGLMSFEFKNFDLLENDKGVLIVSNHPTLIDYVVIISKLKYCNLIVKEQLWHNPFVKRVIQSAGYIPNLQSGKTLNSIKDTLIAGENALIFPEGTRTTPGQPLQLKRGSAQIAIRAKAPIRIIQINCDPSTLTKHTKWYKIPEKKSRYSLKVGDLINPDDFLKDTETPIAAAKHLTVHLKTILEKGI
jgi:1-acyl-sn-glycerol-3-phosphate acyltransferase